MLPSSPTIVQASKLHKDVGTVTSALQLISPGDTDQGMVFLVDLRTNHEGGIIDLDRQATLDATSAVYAQAKECQKLFSVSAAYLAGGLVAMTSRLCPKL